MSAASRRNRRSPEVWPSSRPCGRGAGYTMQCPRLRTPGHRRRVAPTPYILADLPWAVLLEPILRQALPGATSIVYTDAMRAHVEQALHAAGRTDLVVRQQRAPTAAGWS